MRDLCMAAGMLALLCGCGSDEAITNASSTSETRNVVAVPTDAGLLDICGAFWSMASAPGTAERLCALRTDNSRRRGGVEQCKLCAASLSFVEELLPSPACYAGVDECDVSNGELHACFEVVGTLLAETVEGCEGRVERVDTAAFVLRLASSSCGPVIAECKPARDLLASLIGAAL